MNIHKLAFISALSVSILAANGAVAGADVYGKINVSLQQLENQDNAFVEKDAWDLISNASRFGVKASTDFGNTGLRGVAKIEYEVSVDEGDFDGSDELKARNMYAGVQGNFGTVIAGQFDTPLKTSQGKVDLFNDLTYGDIKNFMPGENRADDIVMYSSPKMEGDIAFNLAFMPGEETGDDAEDGYADYYSASVVYETSNLYLALASEEGVNAGGSSAQRGDTKRVTAQYKAGDLAIGGIYQTAEASDPAGGDQVFEGLSQNPSLEMDSWVLSLSYTVGQNMFKAQYGESEGELVGVDYTSLSLGWDYMVDKKSKVFVYYSKLTDELTFFVDDYEAKTFGVGYEYAF